MGFEKIAQAHFMIDNVYKVNYFGACRINFQAVKQFNRTIILCPGGAAEMNIRIGKLFFDPTIVMYLVIIDKLIKKHIELVKVGPTEKFQQMVREQVLAYVHEGKEPPAEIAGAVMNLGDDLMAGRDPVIRAGDYIALMNYGRTNKLV
jgi:hypothetical protein